MKFVFYKQEHQYNETKEPVSNIKSSSTRTVYSYLHVMKLNKKGELYNDVQYLIPLVI